MENLTTVPSQASILVVEDDAALRALYAAILTRRGFLLEFVNDGSEALDSLAARSYSVMLLDLMMPLRNGFDVLDRLHERDHQILRRTIVATGVSERDLARIDRNRVFAVLRKPFDLNELVGTIDECAKQSGGNGNGNGNGNGGDPINLESSLRRFEAAVPELRVLLNSEPKSHRELLLAAELRKAIHSLGDLLSAAAPTQLEEQRARHFEAAARNALGLAGAPQHKGH